MQTDKPNSTEPSSEKLPTPKLSLVTEGQNLPDNSQQVVQVSGPPMNSTSPNVPNELTKDERKYLAKQMRKMSAKGMQPAPGFQWNPLLKLEPNIPCPCLSGKKFKGCCRDKLAPVVQDAIAEEFKKQMAMPDLVFLTPDNEQAVKARIAPHVKAEMEKNEKIAAEKAAFEKRKIDDALSKSKR